MYKSKEDPATWHSTEEPYRRPIEDESIREDALRRNEVLIEQIWKDLDGRVPRCEIEIMLDEVAPAYDDARIQTFVPIFLRREVTRRLQREMAPGNAVSSLAPDVDGDGSSIDFVEYETPVNGSPDR